MTDPTEQQNALAEKWRGLVHHIIRRHVLPTISAERLAEIGGRDELVAGGYLKLVQISRAYDPSRASKHTGKPVAFSTLAVIGLRRHFLQVVMFRRPSERIHPMDLCESDAEPATGGDVADLAAKNERRLRIAKAVEGLPNRLRKVIEMRFYGGLTFQDASNRLGITRERVRQLEAQALAGVAEALGGPVPMAWAKMVSTIKAREARQRAKRGSERGRERSPGNATRVPVASRGSAHAAISVGQAQHLDAAAITRDADPSL